MAISNKSQELNIIDWELGYEKKASYVLLSESEMCQYFFPRWADMSDYDYERDSVS